MGKNEKCLLQEEILNVLRKIKGDIKHGNIVDSGMISSVQVDNKGQAIILIEVDPKEGSKMEELRQKVERAVTDVKGIKKVIAVLTAEKPQNYNTKHGKNGGKGDPHGMNKNPPVDVLAKYIIVVASGKGGVGKSTLSANLAVSLANKYGKKVGLLDADIYGPSQPLMMGDEAYKPQLNDDKKLIPANRYGIKIMSIGFIADSKKALVWRGPMVQSAFYQMLRDVDWAREDDPLDYLVIDLPPGTGDVQLTLAQKVKVSGAVIISTPQDIALIDARRAVEMFEKTRVPVLGLVENMSSYICSNCAHEEHIFGHGGVEDEAKSLGIKFLGSIPLSKDVCMQSDKGIPIVISGKNSVAAYKINDISSKIIAVLG